MKCVICHSSDIEEKTVNEAFWVEQDVVLVPCRVLVCNNCGERYYDRQMMRRLEEIEEHLRVKTLALETVGQVMKVARDSLSVLTAYFTPFPVRGGTLQH